MPANHSAKSYYGFLTLPDNDVHCMKVDTMNGLWVWCKDCNCCVYARKERPYTLSRWNDHKKSDPKHLEVLRRKRFVATLELKQKSKTAKLTTLEADALKQNQRNQVSLNSFFAKKKKSKLSPQTSTNSNSTSPTSPQPQLTYQSDEPSKLKCISCEGILPDFGKTEMQSCLRVYVIYASIADGSSYKAGFVGQRNLAQIFHSECNGSKGRMRKTASYGTHYACDDCYELG